MRQFLVLSVLAAVCLVFTGCPSQNPSDSASSDIGASGGIVRAGGGSLSIPAGGILNSTKVTLERNKAGVTVDGTEAEGAVSDIFTVTQDGGLLQAKGDTRFVLTIPYNTGAVTAKANTNGHVYALVNTPDGVVRIFGSLVGDTLELSLGGLLDSADFQVVHNPNMVVAAGADTKLTGAPPWGSSNWLIAYDPADPVIIDIAAQLAGKPAAEITAADVEAQVRNPIAAVAQGAAQYYAGLGFRQPNLEVKTIAGVGTGFIVDALPYGGSHYRRGILGSYGELYIAADRLLDSPSGVLGSITQTITHEMFHGIVDGYELEGYPNGNASSFRGHDEGLAQLFGHTRDKGAIAVREGETMFLDQRLGIDTNADAYRSGDFYGYVAKRYGGGALGYVGGVGNGLLEQVRLWVLDRNPNTAAKSYIAYLQGINNGLGGQFSATLNAIYWDFARNRAYEHNDESRLRPGDTLARFSLGRDRFTASGILTRTITASKSSEVVSIPSMATLSSVAIELIASGDESDLTITLDTAGIEPDGLGNSVRAKVYPEGADGQELDPASPEVTLEGFGGGFDHAYIVVSNVSDEKAFAPSFTIAAMPAGDATGIITGRVVDAETDDPVAGAAVTAATNGKAVLGSGTTTDANGQFTLAALPAGWVILEFTAEGYLATQQTVLVIENTTAQVDVSLVVRDTGEAVGDASGTIIDAVTGSSISGVLVELRPDMVPSDDTSGSVVATTTTGAGGTYFFGGIEAGVYTAFLSADGYEDNVLVIYVVGGELSDGQDGELVPQLTADEIRIILTWGANPRDLDSHLTAPIPEGGRFHLFYQNNRFHPYVDLYDLDLDDTYQFGPETTTLHGLIPGTYRYSVHDYTNRNSEDSTALSNSGAQIRVFSSTGVRTFNVTPGRAGTVWTVFEIDGTSGALTTVNDYFFESSPSNAGSFKVIGADPPNLFIVPEK